MSLMGIDLGSGSCKAVLFSENGVLLAHANRAYEAHSPRPGWAEMDAECLWTAVVGVVREVSAHTGGDDVTALAIAAHGETFIPVDRSGLAVGPAILNSDNRATDEAAAWDAKFGKDAIYRITGLPLHAMFAINKIMWLRQHDPQLFAKADRFLSVEDYVLVRMGLPPCIDYSMASRTMAFDIRRKEWSEEILSYAGLRKEQLGIPVPSGEKVGVLSRPAAAELGLREGVIVATGGHDQPCGALGAGVVRPGQVADSAGSYECLAAVSSEPRNTPEALQYALNSYCHVVPDQYITLAFFPAGLVTRWFTEQFCAADEAEAKRTNQTLHDVLAAQVEKSATGPTGLCITPHFVGACNPHWDVRATGAMTGLTPSITRHHMYKAIFEGIACELALNTEVLEKIVGPFDRVTLHGGNARSAFSVQLRADLTGKTMATLEHSEAVCQGAAMLAGVAAGIYCDAQEAAAQWVKVNRTYAPNADASERYAKQVSRYRQLYPALAACRK